MAIPPTRYWACLNPSTQQIMTALANATIGMVNFVPRSVVNAYILAEFGSPASPWVSALQTILDIDAAEIDGKNVWLANKAWMYELYPYIISGELTVSNDDCTFLHFPVYP